MSADPRALDALELALEGCEDAEQVASCAGRFFAARGALRELWFFDRVAGVLHARAAGVLALDPRPLSSLDPGTAALLRAACRAAGAGILEGEALDAAGEAAKVRLLALPLRRGRRLQGVLGLLSARADAFPPALVDALGARAAPLAAAVERVQLRVRERALRAALRAARDRASLVALAAAVAHEIRNPLAAMTQTLTHLAGNPVLDGGDRRLLEVVLDELARANRIASEFLGLVGPRTCHRVPVRVEALVDDVLALLRHDPRARRSLRLGAEIAADLPTLHLDPDRIRQVLWNLGLNAVQAAPENGRVAICVQTRRSGGRDGVCIAVRDDGPGVPAALRARVFRPFESTREHGTGLGLAIAKHAVELHRGWIRIEDAPGGGACVRFWLPADGDPEPPHGGES